MTLRIVITTVITDERPTTSGSNRDECTRTGRVRLRRRGPVVRRQSRELDFQSGCHFELQHASTRRNSSSNVETFALARVMSQKVSSQVAGRMRRNRRCGRPAEVSFFNRSQKVKKPAILNHVRCESEHQKTSPSLQC